jgi:hypothetical protein
VVSKPLLRAKKLSRGLDTVRRWDSASTALRINGGLRQRTQQGIPSAPHGRQAAIVRAMANIENRFTKTQYHDDRRPQCGLFRFYSSFDPRGFRLIATRARASALRPASLLQSWRIEDDTLFGVKRGAKSFNFCGAIRPSNIFRLPTAVCAILFAASRSSEASLVTETFLCFTDSISVLLGESRRIHLGKEDCHHHRRRCLTR